MKFTLKTHSHRPHTSIIFGNKEFPLIRGVAEFIKSNNITEFTTSLFINKKKWKHIKFSMEINERYVSYEGLVFCRENLKNVFRRIPKKIYYR